MAICQAMVDSGRQRFSGHTIGMIVIHTLPSLCSKISVKDFQFLESTRSMNALLSVDASGYKPIVKLEAELSYGFEGDVR